MLEKIEFVSDIFGHYTLFVNNVEIKEGTIHYSNTRYDSLESRLVWKAATQEKCSCCNGSGVIVKEFPGIEI